MEKLLGSLTSKKKFTFIGAELARQIYKIVI
jgi:hypothetical protein